jgi:hypothetical protein
VYPRYNLQFKGLSMKKHMQQERIETRIAPHTVCKLCRYNLSDVCEGCQVDPQLPWFEERRNLTLEELPRFPVSEFNNGISVKARQILIAVYMEKITERLQGLG